MPRHVSLQIDELVLQGVTLSPREAVLFERSFTRTLEELLTRNQDWGASHTTDRVALALDPASHGQGPSHLSRSSAESLGESVGRTLAGHVFPSSSGEASC